MIAYCNFFLNKTGGPLKHIITFLIVITLTVQAQYFVKITTGPQSNDGGDSRSVNWVDYDNDGDLDLFISNGPSGKANCFLYKNEGNGTFSKITNLSIVNDAGSYDGSTWADYDNDGYIDAFTATWYGQLNSLHRQRNGVFEKSSPMEISKDFTYSETASWGDYDNDGFVDLYLANSSVNLANFLYHNNGDGTFTKIMQGSIVTDAVPSRSVDWCDFDNDGDVDLFVANEGGANSSLYWNNGDGNFVGETAGAIVNDGGDSFGSSVADFDNDGDFDVLVVNHGNENEFLYRNNGNKTFTKIIDGAVVNSGGYSVGSAFGDLDNDGDLDLMVTNAFAGNSQVKNFLYLNNGDGTFVKVDSGVVSTDLGWSYGVAFGDYDRDGDLDIATANCFGANQNNSLYKNMGNANKWLTIKAVGKVSNFSAIGAKVKVKATINGKAVWQLRQVAGQSGYCGQNLESHFGLGDATLIDSLVVLFPSGQIIVQTNISPNQYLTITESIPTGFLRGAMQISNFEEMAPLQVQFKDISTVDPANPINSWKWDFTNDGSIDTITASAAFKYAAPDTYSVRMIVSNGITSDTVISKKSIIVTPAASILQFNTNTHNFGVIDVNVKSKDTTVFISNSGKLADSIFVKLVYGSSGPGTVKPDSALSIQPTAFLLQPNSSQGITFTIYPPKVNRTNLNITYTPKIIVTSKSNLGPKVFEKTMWVKLQGTLSSIGNNEQFPTVYSLHQNFPNPFNPLTVISYNVPKNNHVSLKVFDAIGREIVELVNREQTTGKYSVNFNGDALSSGLYFYRLISGNFIETRKMVLLK